MVGACVVLPGPGLDGPSLVALIDTYKVSIALGVPTIWLGLLGEAEKAGSMLQSLMKTVVGGSACPPSMISAFRETYGVETIHAWGMTEMSPLGSVNQPLAKHNDLELDALHRLRENQGRPPWGVELEILGEDGEPLAHDGATQGELVVRGPFILDAYFRSTRSETLQNGWFNTGDVATLDPDGFLTICDRSKDIIKSGGEWISSVELENIAIAHPDLADAAVIGARHKKWDERPVLIAVPAPGKSPSQEELLSIFEGKIAKWQVPDMVVMTDILPRNATGKVLKRTLREKFGDVLEA
jgi:fatty-acyl-CoA synthase